MMVEKRIDRRDEKKYFVIHIKKDNKEFTFHDTYKTNDLWISNEDGEGMVIKESELYDIIKKYFDETF